MTWNNPPPIVPTKAKAGKRITPEMIAGKSEGSQQKALMVWVSSHVSKYPELKWLFHIPNGGTRNVREAVELKAQGVKAGIPDLMLPCGMSSPIDGKIMWLGCFIEMKAGKNKPTKEQWEWMAALESFGYYTKVCYSWQEARDTLINYLEGKV